MEFGLREADLVYIVENIKTFSEIKKAAIFGSRAKGTFKDGSDVDIAVFGDDINFDIVSKLHSKLEDESPLPYLFDIVDYTHLDHMELREHIERVGRVIYLSEMSL